jgi:hypothetical protein
MIKEPRDTIYVHVSGNNTPDFIFYYEDFKIAQVNANCTKNNTFYRKIPEDLFDEMLEYEHDDEKLFEMYYNYLMKWLKNEKSF